MFLLTEKWESHSKLLALKPLFQRFAYLDGSYVNNFINNSIDYTTFRTNERSIFRLETCVEWSCFMCNFLRLITLKLVYWLKPYIGLNSIPNRDIVLIYILLFNNFKERNWHLLVENKQRKKKTIQSFLKEMHS